MGIGTIYFLFDEGVASAVDAVDDATGGRDMPADSFDFGDDSDDEVAFENGVSGALAEINVLLETPEEKPSTAQANGTEMDFLYERAASTAPQSGDDEAEDSIVVDWGALM